MLTQVAWGRVKLLRKMASDPVWFVRQILGVQLWKKQAQILMDLCFHREVSVKSCHSAGKSFLAACAALWFLYSHPGALVLTTAPTDRQVRAILWKEITTLHRKASAKLGGDVLQKEIKLDTDWWAMGFTAPEYDPDRFQGFHAEHLLFIVDEASGVSPLIYEAVESIATGAHNKLLLIGNPTDPNGDFAQSFKRPDVCKHTITAFDTPNFQELGITLQDIRDKTWKQKTRNQKYPYPTLATPEWVASRWEKWGEDSPMWRARVIAQFPEDSDNCLVPLSWIEQAEARWHEREEAQSWSDSCRGGLDVASMGANSTVLAAFHDRQGLRQLHKRRKSSAPETVGWVNMLLKIEDTMWHVRVDADGYGAAIYQLLREDHGSRIIEMRGGFPSREREQYFDNRSEWFWTVRANLDPKGPSPWALCPDDELPGQLSGIKWSLSRKGLIKVETKDEMRSRGMSSPDEADALAYAAARVSGTEVLSFDPDDGRIQPEGGDSDGPL